MDPKKPVFPDDFKVNGCKPKLRFRKIKCGDPSCTSCPHGTYLYIEYTRETGKKKEFYVGAMKQPV